MRFQTSLSSISKFGSVILALTILGLQSPLAYATHGLYTSNLNGAQEVPPNASTGTATGNLTLAGTAINCAINVSGLTGPVTGAHIHQGPPGANGPIIVTLTGIVAGFGPPTSFLCTSATLTAAQIIDLDAGNLYFNVHTAAFPGGEIRGQILHAPLAGPAAPIPTLSQWGIILLSLSIVSAIWWRRGLTK